MAGATTLLRSVSQVLAGKWARCRSLGLVLWQAQQAADFATRAAVPQERLSTLVVLTELDDVLWPSASAVGWYSHDDSAGSTGSTACLLPAEQVSTDKYAAECQAAIRTMVRRPLRRLR